MEADSNTATTQLAGANGEEMLRQQSPFLNPGDKTRANGLAIVQLSKGNLIPVVLRDTPGEHDGYKEGYVINTRFGSFPHSTMIGVSWGSQVKASKVDTGSRGRKRKRAQKDEGDNRTKDAPDETAATMEMEGEEVENSSAAQSTTQNAKDTARKVAAATSGFVYILPPTPELWTSSLPHRTQVVYTPDYSYILQRIRARPGTKLIEAGAGSGSFTHAAVRAVYNGTPPWRASETAHNGKVFSFEFHEPRFKAMQKEIADHGLDRLVQITHRDVYKEGFLVGGKSPEADAVFLDLPAPWEALPHLSRRRPVREQGPNGDQPASEGTQEQWISPLNPNKSVYICTFSPCIEQVMRTVSEMRKLGWVDIDMVEIANKKIQVYREKIGLDVISERGMQQAPRDISEAIAKLKEIEAKTAEHNTRLWASQNTKVEDNEMDVDGPEDEGYEVPIKPETVEDGGGTADAAPDSTKKAPVKPWLQGQLMTRTDTEVKVHTSYLVFAIMPREWTEEDDAAALAKWPCGNERRVIGGIDRQAKKQERRELLQQLQDQGKKNKKNKEKKAAAENTDTQKLQ